MSDEFITTEDFIKAHHSPLLQPAQPNYRSYDTPPPLPDLDEDYDSDATETRGEGSHVWKSKSTKGRPQPSLCDSLLIKLLGPDYPDVASKAAREFFTLSPEIACEDRRPLTSSVKDRMLDDTVRQRLSGSTDEAKVLARAAFEASEKLNAAIQKDGRGVYSATILQSGSRKYDTTVHVHEIDPETTEIVNGIRHTQVDSNYSSAHAPGSGLSSPRSLNVRPPPKMTLPSIRTNSPDPRSERANHSSDSIATSPALAKFAITPADGNSQQQLPKMQTSPQQSVPGQSPRTKQTLPSLQTALKQIPEPDVAVYSAQSSSISRQSPVQLLQFGPSPSTYSSATPTSAISPPRLLTHPSYWRTASNETSNSTPSDQTSTAASAGISTPASSYYGHSPSNSVNTPGTVVPDLDNMSAISASSSQLTDGGHQYNGVYGNGAFKCNFAGCNAPPFQTQYLLNSHANVHSNTRPHFCPVQGCPRGPGGQGFKRKNEMIRHGLVHQSPGYVCPFCADQQHKYPRPDNLQRHVRVHHVDRDRDDPLLREVLAQRPEGGNRGRRRRLGS